MDKIKEEWKIIEDCSDYSVSSLGRIKRIARAPHTYPGMILVPSVSKTGYLKINLWKNKKRKCFLIHRLVFKAFGYNYDEKLQCNHKNGIKNDNRIENLEMITCSENHKHAFKIGLKCQKGEKHNSSKLKNEDIVLIKKILYFKRKGKIKDTQKQIGRLFNVGQSAIHKIKSGKRWSHVGVSL